MYKKSHVRRPFHKKHGKGGQALLKSDLNHLYHILDHGKGGQALLKSDLNHLYHILDHCQVC